MYESGVYSRSQFASGTTPLGYHSVKIIGWGEERNVPYWVKYFFQLSSHLSGNLRVIKRYQKIEEKLFVHAKIVKFRFINGQKSVFKIESGKNSKIVLSKFE